MIVSLVAFFLTLPVTVLAVWQVLLWLRRQQIFDRPNERSSHNVPTPRGGGLAVTPVILLGWVLVAFWGERLDGETPVLLSCLGLLLLSWKDDRVSLKARTRLALHLAAVVVGLVAFPADRLFFQGWLPFWADRAVGAFLWLWFLNLFNFMDGIDGISGVETACLAVGLILLGSALPQSSVMAAAALGFLAWNWHPARIFLGDSGSIPLGYLLGWLLLRLSSDGDWAAALILPAYYWADASLTLFRRMVRREKIWQAHREHFYQQAVQAGVSHSRVALLILLANILLIAVALLWRAQPIQGLTAALIVTAVLLELLRRLGRGQRA
jgi:UDP-N-acetylmuramyl pentapeptide phosphotransferase/UDP-N-acetylglucosamine-1-phosphate transferase